MGSKRKGSKQGASGPHKKAYVTPEVARGDRAAATLAKKATRRNLDAGLATVMSLVMKRSIMATHFTYEHDAFPDTQGMWDGEDGIIEELMAKLPFTVDPRTVRGVMEAVVECVREGVKYDPQRKAASDGKSMGRDQYIPLKSVYARIIADTVEGGLGVRVA